MVGELCRLAQSFENQQQQPTSTLLTTPTVPSAAAAKYLLPSIPSARGDGMLHPHLLQLQQQQQQQSLVQPRPRAVTPTKAQPGVVVLTPQHGGGPQQPPTVTAAGVEMGEGMGSGVPIGSTSAATFCLAAPTHSSSSSGAHFNSSSSPISTGRGSTCTATAAPSVAHTMLPNGATATNGGGMFLRTAIPAAPTGSLMMSTFDESIGSPRSLFAATTALSKATGTQHSVRGSAHFNPRSPVVQHQHHLAVRTLALGQQQSQQPPSHHSQLDGSLKKSTGMVVASAERSDVVGGDDIGLTGYTTDGEAQQQGANADRSKASANGSSSSESPAPHHTSLPQPPRSLGLLPFAASAADGSGETGPHILPAVGTAGGAHHRGSAIVVGRTVFGSVSHSSTTGGGSSSNGAVRGGSIGGASHSTSSQGAAAANNNNNNTSDHNGNNYSNNQQAPPR